MKEQFKEGGLKSLGWRLHILVFITAFVIVVVRKSDVILNPQFWAEDGAIFYANAYNAGIIHSLFLPLSGYFQSISRLVAAFAQIFPFSLGPLIFNIIAIVIKVLPVNLLLSSRFTALVPNLWTRMFMSFLYLALPNSWEIHANITNIQWYLALLAFMVIIAEKNDRFTWRCFDMGIVLLSGLSGPFCILLTPIIAFKWWLNREKRLFFLLLLVGICALIQGTSLFLLGKTSRYRMTLGATPELFVRILSSQIFLGTLIGRKYTWIVSSFGWYSILALIVSVIGLIVIVKALLKAPVELRLFIVFAAIISVAALISPTANPTMPQWEHLAIPGNSPRYWFIPMLAFIMVLVWMLSKSCSRKLRIFAMTALVIMSIGIIKDWHHNKFKDYNFQIYAQQFELAPKGSKIIIPINPPGWFMMLIKH